MKRVLALAALLAGVAAPAAHAGAIRI